MTNSPEYIPGLAGVPAARTSVCYLDGEIGKLQYRGYPIEALSEHCTFEEVSYLLLYGALPTRDELKGFEDALKNERAVDAPLFALLRTLPTDGHPMDALMASVAALGMFYPGDHVTDRDYRFSTAIRLIAKMPTIVAAWHRIRRGEELISPKRELSHAANFLYMLEGNVPSKTAERVFDVALTLHAEHSMNASTFSGRVTGSTLANPHAAIAAAVGTLSGSLHGGANERVLVMLREIEDGSVEGTRRWAEDRLSRKEKIMGFGHREYKVKDPRAVILQKLAVSLFEEMGPTPIYDTALALESAMEDLVGAKGIYPNVDFYSGIVYERLGIPVDLFTPIFAISRVSGWLAHLLEQLEDNRIFRPNQIWTGEADRALVPIDQRG
ncbi:MAG: citrate synthase [Sandaracinaceae bacterium]|nr:citrate synthase [Sandaracinaceae bacterium]